MKRSAKRQLWIWYWIQGGYNSAVAFTREEALAKAAQLSGNTVLKIDVDSLHIGTHEELRKLERMYFMD